MLLSTAYMFGSPVRSVENEYAKVRAENDWVAGPGRQVPEAPARVLQASIPCATTRWPSWRAAPPIRI
ncbi:hypothetical protein LP420_33270 [Massilia sp. B-10]|nr:hypothetical protein LP420_33270 [Massilia sp. B-10]